MTYYELSRSSAAPLVRPPREPFPGEAEALESAAAAGRRAAGWLRALPCPEDQNWISGLADAIEEATRSLDPGDCDDVDRWGEGGVSEALRERLDAVWGVAGADWLSPGHKALVLAMAGAVLGMPRMLANDPVTALLEEIPALCAVLDSAAAIGDAVAALPGTTIVSQRT
ncbi:hypothetical protein [Streptomyces sp. NRRL F-525]|uniref:hypothetical protein n=1 Tax=Streptomyces sp. NRRL F-525 TaxID=1463861 RepID=UPI00052766DB|nr:hypothetical protein [Streptomyces sp. NRRL F-525]